MKFNNKGQGALEYLLLIGGAVLIAVIVIALLVGMGSSSRETAQGQANTVQQAVTGTAVPVILNSVSCVFVANANPTLTTATYSVGYVPTDGTHQVVIDGSNMGAAAANIASVVVTGATNCGAAGRHNAVVRTTVGTSTATSNQVFFDQ